MKNMNENFIIFGKPKKALTLFMKNIWTIEKHAFNR